MAALQAPPEDDTLWAVLTAATSRQASCMSHLCVVFAKLVEGLFTLGHCVDTSASWVSVRPHRDVSAMNIASIDSRCDHINLIQRLAGWLYHEPAYSSAQPGDLV